VKGGRGARLGARTTLALLAVAGALLGASMAVYPGGTWMDRTTSGYRFWENFFCDLQQPVALNGVSNPVGSRLGQLGMLALFAAWIPLWTRVVVLLPGERYATWTYRLGILASVAACAIPLLPSSRWGSLHAVAIIVASLPGIAALLLALVGIVRSPGSPPWLRTLTVLFVGAAYLDAIFYAVHVIHGGEVPVLLPAAQEAASILLVAWMVGVVRVAGRDTSS
jgi:hypothetical protein